MRDPTLLWQPWVGHWFPGLTPDFDCMVELSWAQYVAMWDFARG